MKQGRPSIIEVPAQRAAARFGLHCMMKPTKLPGGGWVAAWREGRHSHSCVEAKKLLFEPVLNCVILLNGIVLHAWHH